MKKLTRQELAESIQSELDVMIQSADKLPEKKDMEILKKVRAVWVLSGSGSYFVPLSNSTSDQANINNLWYYGTDRARLDYVAQWLLSYAKVLPKHLQPVLIYNGVKNQQEDLIKAIQTGKYKVPLGKIFFPPGDNTRTIDQIKNFALPPNINLEDGYLGVLSHAPHLLRTLKFMKKNQMIFGKIKILALPLKLKDEKDQNAMNKPEIKGMLDYVDKGIADPSSRTYKLL